MRKLLLLSAVLVFAACGDDAAGSNNGENNGSNNGGANNGDPAFEGFSLTLEGGEDIVELPDVSGSNQLGGSKVGNNFQLTGIDDQVELIATLDVGEALEATEYTPMLFSIDYKELEYKCVSKADFVVTVTAVEPAQGSYTGTVSCMADTVSPDTTFDADVSGEWGVTL